MTEASFSTNESSSFLHISNDNRIHLWDTNTHKERRTYVEKQHLAHSYTCSAWRAGKKDNLGYFAVGTSDGTIIIWDLTRGVVSKLLGKANESPSPTSLVFSNDSKSLIVSSSQNQIVQYDLTTGEETHSFKAGKKGVLKIAVNPKVEVVAAAGSSVRLIEIESGRKRKLEAQFSGEVVALVFTQCGRYLAVAGSGSREVLLFDVQAGAEATPMISIAVVGEPRLLYVRSVPTDDGERIEVLCLFEDIHGCLIRYDLEGNKDIASVCKISTVGGVMAGQFGNAIGGKMSSDITLAVGSKSSPAFVSATIEDDEGIMLESIHVGKSVIKSSMENVLQEDSSEAPVAVTTVILGPYDTGGAKRPLISDDIAVIGDKKRSKKSEALVADGELTLEQRLESLSASLIEVEKTNMATSSSNSSDEGPSSNSLVVLIDQALQSGDDALLEQSLACDEASIVDATARRLAPGRVVQLLRRLVAKFEKRPSRGLLLTRWLSAVLKFHTSFLISVPDLSAQLAGLSQMLEQRLSSYSRLASLGGRLDLLMSQITSQVDDNSNGKKRVDNNTAMTPRQVYTEA